MLSPLAARLSAEPPSPAGTLGAPGVDAKASAQRLRAAVNLPTVRLAVTMPHATQRRTRVDRGFIVPGEASLLVAETAARIFADFADPQTINRASDGSWTKPLWDALDAAGLPLAWVPEALGGSGGSIADGFAVLGAAGRFALATPLAETLLAGWLLAQGGIDAPATPMTVAPCRPRERISFDAEGRLGGRVSGVPFAREAKHIALLADDGASPQIAIVQTEQCRVSQGRTLAGDPLDTILFDRVKPSRVAAAPAGFNQESFMLMGSAIRSVEIAGALETILALSVAYANERVAFERRIGKFQAVQQNLARLAGETAAAVAVSGSAADAIADAEQFEDGVFLEAASAKIRTAEAAAEGAAIAHQVFGAIGFTQEHVLHRFTLRLLSWRDDFGNESYWANELGKRAARRGADEFWPWVASR
jgi:acyl-CoA dehydrogenase